MALDPCTDGCLNHMIPSNTVPLATDDPCNGAGNGYFCQGSYWLYDPTEAGADPATDGDCPRLFLRNGGDCGVYQWVEIALAGLISDTVAPVDGTDCCPPGTLWCVPAAGGVSTDQIWISTNGCGATACTWCKLCGEPAMIMNYVGPSAPFAEGIQYGVTDTSINFDNFSGMAVGTGVYTIPENGFYDISVWAACSYTGINFDSAIMRVGILRNGAQAIWLDQSTLTTYTRPGANLLTVLGQGSGISGFAAGDTAQMIISWSMNFGGSTLVLDLADFRLNKIQQ